MAGELSRRGDRKGRKVGFPKFKSKNKETPKFAYTAGGFGLIDGDPKALRLPKIGRVHCMENVAERVGDAKVLRMTISQRAGRWYASLTVEREEPVVKSAPKGGAVGVDLGVKHLATLSDGTVVENPRYCVSLSGNSRKRSKRSVEKPKARTAAPRLVRRWRISMRVWRTSVVMRCTSSQRGSPKSARRLVLRT